MKIVEGLYAAHEELTSWRQHLHQNPEIAYEEEDTSNFVAGKLESFGVKVHRNFGGTGLVGVIEGNQGDLQSGKAIGLRADMDALPMPEETNLPYASKRDNRMHACGHDGHTTMLLGAARYLAQTRNFNGTVYCIFQPAEEGGNAGARSMINDGLFEKFHMDSVWGMHNWPGLEVGRAVAHCGPAMAGADIFILTVNGKGGHAAMPHLTRDPIAATGMCVVALQTLISRQLDPFDHAVISLTKLEAGSAYNVIPASATIGGTVRTMKAQTRERLIREIETVAQNAAATLGCDVSMELRPGYPPTLNHEEDALYARAVITDMLGPDALETEMNPVMGAEDFSFMLQQKPGAYIWLGAGMDSENLHSPHFDFNDDLLPIGSSFWVQLAESKLA
ncbi:M20 family metallopeptidase [Candidatus Puniceispirillum sp.]|nr:M20 family metallopeptidase [Candidatus Puniceispirillum sp.]